MVWLKWIWNKFQMYHLMLKHNYFASASQPVWIKCLCYSLWQVPCAARAGQPCWQETITITTGPSTTPYRATAAVLHGSRQPRSRHSPPFSSNKATILFLLENIWTRLLLNVLQGLIMCEEKLFSEICVIKTRVLYFRTWIIGCTFVFSLCGIHGCELIDLVYCMTNLNQYTTLLWNLSVWLQEGWRGGAHPARLGPMEWTGVW